MNRLCSKGFLSAFLVLATFVFFMGSVQAVDFYVSTSTELQSALNHAAANGENDIILVNQGTYYGNFVYDSDEPYDLAIMGGGYETVLEGDEWSSVLFLNIDAVGNIYVSGITLQHGWAHMNGGGGLYAKTHGNVVLEDSIVQENYSENWLQPTSGYGAGVYAEGNSVYLARNLIQNNYNLSAGLFGAGGGAYLVANGSGIELSDNIIIDNEANANGGGVYAVAAQSSIRAYRNTIRSNLALFSPKGGGAFFSAGTLYEEPGQAILVNNVITNNRAVGPLDTIGGGLYVEAGDVTLTHNTIANNEAVIAEEELVILDGPAPAAKGGGAYIYTWGLDTINVYNNIFWHNYADTEHGKDLYVSGVGAFNTFNNNLSYAGYFGPAMGTGNQDNDDPVFNPGFVDEASPDYHLLYTSPCIFAALATAPWEPNDDREGLGRPMPAETDPDIGAYEFQYTPCDADFSADPIFGPAPLMVHFADESTGDIETWYWDFGDGETSTDQDPSHIYTFPGLHTVSLTVSGDGGTCVETKVNYIDVCESVVADFTADPTDGYNVLTVQFSDLSTGDIETWEWDFGDGSATSPEQDPSHQYINPGLYTVTLTVTGCDGMSTNTKMEFNYIHVWDCTVTPSFTTDPSPPEGPAPLTIQFTDTSTGDVDNWYWEFGDGATSEEQNPEHTYYDYPSTYLASLSITGCNGTVKSEITITVGYPVPEADFSATPTTGTAPLDVNFTDLSTGSITSWAWDFGDGTSTEQNPSHTYTAPGVYTVSLTVTNPDGETDTETKIHYITVAEPAVADFSAAPTTGTAPLDVNFTDLSTGDITSWSWNFGDGTSTEQNPSHIYTTPGVYTVTLTVAGPGGTDTEEKIHYITVAEPAPVADFSATPTAGSAPLDVNFTDLSTGSITSWAWDFGDGTSATQNPSHIYTTPGTYTVSLTVTGPGGTDTEEKIHYITVAEPAVADFSATPTAGSAPLDVNFTDLSTGDITSWSWNFGDGGTSAAQNPPYTYIIPGAYTVSLTVTGPGGTDTETKIHYITVAEPAPVADFSATPTTGTAPLDVNFTDLSIGTITSWSWNFGDGGTSTAQNPIHKYNWPGDYTVSLTVTGPKGMDTETKIHYITVTSPAPVADFSATPTTGMAPLDVNFTDLSIGSITSWAWDFGDGETSTTKDPAHTYITPGDYTVSLTVTGPGGTDTEEKIDYITVTVTLPDVSITLTPDETVIPRGGTLGVGVTITNNTNVTQMVGIATNVTLPNGVILPVFGPIPVTLNAFESKYGHLSHTIPGIAPLGDYTYHGYVGKPGVGIIDQDQFDFEVTEGYAGPEEWETTVDKALE